MAALQYRKPAQGYAARCAVERVPDGSIRHGYDFIAPLTDEGRIDLDSEGASRRMFRPPVLVNEPSMQGLLVDCAGGLGGSTWTFEWKGAKGPAAVDEDEGYRFADHLFKVGNMCRCRGARRPVADLPGRQRRQAVTACPDPARRRSSSSAAQRRAPGHGALEGSGLFRRTSSSEKLEGIPACKCLKRPAAFRSGCAQESNLIGLLSPMAAYPQIAVVPRTAGRMGHVGLLTAFPLDR